MNPQTLNITAAAKRKKILNTQIIKGKISN